MEPLDLNDSKRRKVIKGAPADRGKAQTPPDAEVTDAQQAEDDKQRELHGKLISWYRRELEIQAQNRFEQALDADYRDGIQLSQEELDVLNERGQPPMVYNVIATSLNWIMGSE
jgi:hypothetical protein